MLTEFSAAYIITDLVLFTLMIVLIVLALSKYTNEHILRCSGALYISAGAVTLIVSGISLIMASMGNAEISTVQLTIRLLFGVVEAAVGIVVYKSRLSVSVVSFIVACAALVISLADLIANRSFASKLAFASMLLAVLSMIRGFREEERKSGDDTLPDEQN